MVGMDEATAGNAEFFSDGAYSIAPTDNINAVTNLAGMVKTLSQFFCTAFEGWCCRQPKVIPFGNIFFAGSYRLQQCRVESGQIRGRNP